MTRARHGPGRHRRQATTITRRPGTSRLRSADRERVLWPEASTAAEPYEPRAIVDECLIARAGELAAEQVRSPDQQTVRFLKRSGCLAVTTTGLFSGLYVVYRVAAVLIGSGCELYSP
jgi:hypothetical protein